MYQNIPGRIQTPTIRSQTVYDDENSPHNGSIPSSINKFNQSKNLYDSGNISNPSLDNSLINRSVPRVLNNKTQFTDFKVQVIEMLKNDANRIDYNALSSTTERAVTSVSPLESIAVSVKEEFSEVLEEEEIEVGNEDINLPSTKTLLSNSVEQFGSKTPELYHFYDDYQKEDEYDHEEELEEEESFLDPRVSFLNPHQPFVKVAPLMLGQPLAENGTPLDLSSVPKRSNAGPLYNDDDEDVMTKDEKKIYALLEYELNKENGSLNGGHYFNFAEKAKDENKHKSIFYRLFHRPSEEEKYSAKYPWFRILNRIDHPMIEETPEPSSNEFEKNNTDMFPVNYRIPPTSPTSSRRPVSYIPLKN